MKQTLKIKISNLATWIMIGTIGLIILWFLGFIVSVTFDLNVFTSRTSEFFFSIIGFAFVLVTCAAILNISLNISLIADSKVQNIKENETKSFLTRKFFYLSGLLIFLLIGFLFIGDFLSRQNEKIKLENEANDLISRFSQSIEEMTLFIQDTSQIEKIPEFLKVLSNQKEEFPTITLITSDNYKGETVFLEINNWASKHSLKEPYFDHSFYKCNLNDCEYLQKVFENNNIESYFWTEKNNYKYYYPVEKNGKKIVLLFTKFERYGKIGS
jgi:ABC-type multidrug transport system fused ATPase/permease subunit